MNNLSQALWVELLKARRSKMPLLTALVFIFLPLVGGLFMVILKDPEMARQMGLISAKAQLTMGEANWGTYFNFLILGMAAGGVVVFGFITSWVFGREYADQTLKDLLALPTRRTTIVLAKFIVIGIWSLILAFICCITGLIVGSTLLPQSTGQFLGQSAVTLVCTCLLTMLLMTTVAFFASFGRGYLPPVAFTFLVMVLAQVSGILGWGEYFPWAIPGMWAQREEMGMASWVILALTSVMGLAGTVMWWKRADQT
jgi:ABC-2 type transport system permease protein